jgi:hypothetical protein
MRCRRWNVLLAGLAIFRLSPVSAPLNSPSLTMEVLGLGFTPTCVVRWNEEPLATVYRDGQDLSAVVPSDFLAQGGSVAVSVIETLTGERSNAMAFRVSP